MTSDEGVESTDPLESNSLVDSSQDPGAEIVQTDGLQGEATVRRRGSDRLKVGRKKTLRRVLVVLIVMVLCAGGLTWFVVRAPKASFVPILNLSSITPGTAPAVVWPAEGQGAWAIPAFGATAGSPNQASIPIGSTAKMMTALVVLFDHPLALGQSGPSFTVTAQDKSDYDATLTSDQSHIAVTVGESLTEYQLLEGLLIHSGNNYANMLARWDAGSIPAFVKKMNDAASSLGLSLTHYADASGFDPGTVSTASQQLVVAAQGMRNPVFASIVAKPSVTLPVAGSLGTYTPFVGSNGVIGVKSGLTKQAGGCDVMAYVTTRGGRPTMILTAVFGQKTAPNRLLAAGQASLAMAKTIETGVVAVTALNAGQPVANLDFKSGSSPVAAESVITLPSWPGIVVSVSPRSTREVKGGLGAGSVVGRVRVTSGSYKVDVPIKTQQDIPNLSFWQRLG